MKIAKNTFCALQPRQPLHLSLTGAVLSMYWAERGTMMMTKSLTNYVKLKLRVDSTIRNLFVVICFEMFEIESLFRVGSQKKNKAFTIRTLISNTEEL